MRSCRLRGVALVFLGGLISAGVAQAAEPALLVNPADVGPHLAMPEADASSGLVALSDTDLADVSAGDFATTVNGFDVTIQDNQAHEFTFDIAQSAFDSAHGVFTTLQTVNSAIDLTVIVNIYLGNVVQPGS